MIGHFSRYIVTEIKKNISEYPVLKGKSFIIFKFINFG